MESRKLEIIKQLMEELQDEMQYGEEDLSSRLGRAPKVEVLKMEAEPMEEEGEISMEMGLGEELEDESPEEQLKRRLMKIRG